MTDYRSYRIAFDEKELLVDRKLGSLRKDFLRDYCGHFNTLTDKQIWQSGLYRFCHFLPKGADLHVHCLACMPVKQTAAWAASVPGMHIHTGSLPGRGSLRVFSPGDTIPPEYVPYTGKEISEEELEKLWSTEGYNGTGSIWEWFETIFDRHLFATSDDIVLSYYKAVFDYYLSLGIQEVELRLLPFGTPEVAAQTARAIRKAYYEAAAAHPGFCVKLIGSGLKYAWIEPSMTESMLRNAAYIHENVKDELLGEDFMVAIDLVNEEDRSNDISFYAPMLKAITGEHPSLDMVLHCGDSLHPGSRSMEDAMALGPRRIGHGYDLYRHPGLEKIIMEKDIPLEVCPVSNMSLKYISDVREHPARKYYSQGIPMVLASDDPAFQEHENMTDDFVIAAAAWEFSLSDLKRLAFNSIKYCSASPATKNSLLEEWTKRWNDFVLQNI